MEKSGTLASTILIVLIVIVSAILIFLLSVYISRTNFSQQNQTFPEISGDAEETYVLENQILNMPNISGSNLSHP